MSLTGYSSKSLVKKDLLGEKSPAIAVKQIMFQHQASFGQTVIDLMNLTTPADAAANGFVQPNASLIAEMHLQGNYKNLLLISGAEGKVLAPYISYSVSGTLITLVEPALENEVFIGIISPVIRSDSLVADVDFICVTGELAAGATEIPLPKKVLANFNPNTQVGSVDVKLDGQDLVRNVGNATASPSADGDFQFVPDSGGVYSSIVKINEPSDQIRVYKITSNACSIIRPDGSMVEEIERMQGVIDRLVEVLSDVTGLSESALKAAPTNAQLNAWGSRVISLEQYMTITSNTTLTQAPCRLVAADTSGGSFTLTLPASPSHGDRVVVMDSQRTFGSNTLTIARNGNNIGGIADDLDVEVTGDWVELVFILSYGWSLRQ